MSDEDVVYVGRLLAADLLKKMNYEKCAICDEEFHEDHLFDCDICQRTVCVLHRRDCGTGCVRTICARHVPDVQCNATKHIKKPPTSDYYSLRETVCILFWSTLIILSLIVIDLHLRARGVYGNFISE